MTRYPASKAQLERARKLIPLASQTFSKAYNRWPAESPHFLSHGKGGRVWDIDGNCYVDLVSALLPNVLGYCDPDVDDAVAEQLARGISFSLPTVLEYELAERLVCLIPCAEMVRFGKSGSDATTAAVRLARAYTGRDHVIMCGYHGWHDWSIGWAETIENRKGVPEAVRDLTTYARPDDIHLTMAGYIRKTAAVIVDCSKVGAEELRLVRKRCDDFGTLLIFDEVITGFRWHIGGAQAAYGVKPDLACFSKAMGNGMPISAVVGRADIMSMFDHVFFSGTFNGETLSLAAAKACIDKIERNKVPEHLAAVGETLAMNVPESKHVWLSGHPTWKQLHFSSPEVREAFLTAMLANGVLVNTSHNVCFAHNDDDMEIVLNAYRHAMDEVERVIESKAA